MRYLKRGLTQLAWRQASKAYSAYYKKHEGDLPENLRYMLKRYAFHDAIVQEVSRVSKDRLLIRLDDYDVTFLGVSESDCTAKLVGDMWLYDEVYKHGRESFELLVLLDDSEMRIVARDVCCFYRPTNEWVVGTARGELPNVGVRNQRRHGRRRK